MYHVVTYWIDGQSQYRGSYASNSEACKAAMAYHSVDHNFRVTVVKF